MVVGIIRDVFAAIPAYTGLSPVAFFTIAALLITLFYVVAGFFAPPPTPAPVARYEPPPPPVQLGDVSEAELRAYDGSDPSKPLLMAIKGQIYDVSQSRSHSLSLSFSVLSCLFALICCFSLLKDVN
mgnify:CR=1 FL=1